MKKILILLLSVTLLCPLSLRADQGMWLPILIGQKILDMQKLGCTLTAEDIYSINQACLKDAIVQFGGGCTAEIISDQGLLITNHHCGYGQIQAHSSVEHDYLKDGFWAASRAHELPNNGLRVTFLRSMEDVTDQVLDGVTSTMTEAERTQRIRENTKAITEKATDPNNKFISAYVAPLYYGNQYFLYINESYADVRLVAAPPSSIGKFGGDTDNWMWPRHTGDFSMFRVYAGPNNQPAAYSTDNVPYMPKKHLTISLRGVKEGDFTMVYGYPGRTTEYVLSPIVAYTANIGNPAKIRLRTLRLNIMNAYQAKSQAVRIQYSSKNANVSNAWKKWQGEAKGLVRLGTVAQKEAYEDRFEAWAKSQPTGEYKGLVPKMKALYDTLLPLQFAADLHSEAIQAIELLSFANRLYSAVRTGNMERATSQAESFFKDYYLPLDKDVFKALMAAYYELLPAAFVTELPAEHAAFQNDYDRWADFLYTQSALCYKDKTLALLALPQQEALASLEKDPAYTLINTYSKAYSANVAPTVTRINQALNIHYRTWMRGIMAFDKERVFFPDANSTLRVTYGTVQGYKPSDAVTYLPSSSLEGIMEKDNPDIFDYNIPQSLRDIYAAKDYGRWEVDGSVPVCFIATNHTSGGNSGSPILNAKGQLLGLNFDRVWEGTMSDIQFDPLVCRNISVDIRYVLFVIDKIGHADYLFDEMTFD